jgi:His-Xaa-Ser system protein HxsD
MSNPDLVQSLTLRDAQMHVTVDLRTYRISAIQKSAYTLAARLTVVLGAVDDEHLPLTFVFRPQVSEHDARETVRLFFQDLLDQELREKIADETRALRSLLLAHAFSKTDLIRRDE